MEGGSVVIYQGSKYFWNTRNSIDVIIVKHKIENIVEVIAYEPALDVEAPRLHLDTKILSSKLDREAIAAKMSLAKQNNVPHTEQFVEGVVNGATSEFILNRLFIKQYSKEERIFEIQLQFTCSDREDANGADTLDKLLCDKPASLCPHHIRHHKTPLAGEVDAAINALAEEQRNLKEHCDKAFESQAQTHVPLGVKERWRIPIILAKIEKNVPLTETDAKIWAAVSHNTKIQEDAVSTTVRANTVANAKKSPKTLPNTPTSRGPTPRHSLASVVLAARAQNAYMDGTTTSESRNKAAAKEKALEKEKEKTARKLAKRGSKSKTKSKARKVTSRGSNSNSFDDSDTDQDEAGGTSAAGLIGQFVSGLASLSASVKATMSGKHHSNKVYVEETDLEDMVTSRMSSRGSAKAFGDTLVEPFDPSEIGFNSGLLTSRLSQTLSGDCSPMYTMLGDHSTGAGCFSSDDVDWQVTQLESADPSEITPAPRRRSRISFLPPVERAGDSDEDSMCTKAVAPPTKIPVAPVIASAQSQRQVKPTPIPSVASKHPNAHNQVRFNEVTGMYERQLTASPGSNKQGRLPSFSQALGGVARATANLRASLTFDGQQSLGEALGNWLTWQNNSSIGAC